MSQFETLKKIVTGKLDADGYMVTGEKSIQSGHQYTLSTGTIVNVYETGRIIIQGKADREVNLLFGLKN